MKNPPAGSHRPGRAILKTNPLTFSPRLAAHIGLNQAIMLSQLDYWTEKNAESPRRRRDEPVYNSDRGWQEQFPFWSTDTIKRTRKHLVEAGLIRTDQRAFSRGDRRLRYTVNYDVLDALAALLAAGDDREDASVHLQPACDGECEARAAWGNRLRPQVQTAPYTKTTLETPSETSGRDCEEYRSTAASADGAALLRFADLWKVHLEPPLTDFGLQQVELISNPVEMGVPGDRWRTLPATQPAREGRAGGVRHAGRISGDGAAGRGG